MGFEPVGMVTRVEASSLKKLGVKAFEYSKGHHLVGVPGWAYELATAVMYSKVEPDRFDRVLDRMLDVPGSVDSVKSIVDTLGYLNEGVEGAIRSYLEEIGALS